MKSYGLILLLLAGFMSAYGQQQDFVLSGKIKGQNGGVLKLGYAGADGKQVMDSAAVQNGTFEFRGKLAEPAMAYFSGAVKSRAMDDPNVGYFFLEPGTMTLTVTAGDFKNLQLNGSKTQDEYASLEKLKASINDRMKPVSAAYNRANEVYMQARKDKKPEAELDALKEKASEVKDQFEPFYEQLGKLDMEFIKAHPDSYYAAYVLRWKVSSIPLTESKLLYSKLTERIKQSGSGKGILEEIKALEGGSPGSVAAGFSVNDINGTKLSLGEFKGKKYVLLDFWASWCVPCRKGNPHLLSLYSKYKDKGLEIIGISDDDSAPEAWKKAVEKDGIGVWRHVLRGLKHTAGGFDKSGDITAPFGIHSLPTKILIDKNGMIIGRYGGGGEGDEAMDKKLAEIFSSAAQTTKVTGSLSGLKEDQLTFYYYADGKSVADTVKVKAGKFTWMPKIAEPQKVGTMLFNRYFQFFVEPGDIQLSGGNSTDSVKVIGSKTQDEYVAFGKTLEDIEARQNPLYEKWGKVTKEEQLALEEKVEELRNERRDRVDRYISSHPKSAFSVSLVSEKASMGAYDQVLASYEKLDKSAQQSAEGRRIAERLVLLKRSTVGTQMLDFTQNDTEGKPVKFADFKGKYVLVDFWASWCGPCRAENPNVLKAYHQYKDKNFTVVGVSLDDKSENWKKAIKDDKMPWTQVSDLKGWKNEVSTYYGIMGIPSTLLVDPQGKIIVKDLRGEMLNKKLAELFNAGSAGTK